MSRDRDVRNAVQAALIATGAFDAVWIWGLPEDYGTGASNMAAAALEADETTENDPWDSQPTGGLVMTSVMTITLLYRAEDPQLRDEAAELLIDTTCNALNGQSLARFTIPAWTRVRRWKWEKAAAPERRITARLEYQYIVEGWDSFDTTL